MAKARVVKQQPVEVFDPERHPIPTFKSTGRRHDEPPTKPRYFYIRVAGEPHDRSPGGQALLILAERTGVAQMDTNVYHVSAQNEEEAREVVEGIEKQIAENAYHFDKPVTLVPWKIVGVRAADEAVEHDA